MCDHENVRHRTPKGVTPKLSDVYEMSFWECLDCGETFDDNPNKKSEDDEEINEMSEVRKTLFK